MEKQKLLSALKLENRVLELQYRCFERVKGTVLEEIEQLVFVAFEITEKKTVMIFQQLLNNCLIIYQF